MATRSTFSRARRRRVRIIIDAAVDLFTDHGYGETRLGHRRAGRRHDRGVHYHFDSKAVLGAAIMAQGWPKALTVIDDYLGDSSRPGSTGSS